METAAPGLHDAILLCTVVSAVYFVVALLQLMQLKHNRPVAIVACEPSVRGQPSDAADDACPVDDRSFYHQLRRSSIESDIRRLNREVERLHTALQAMQHDVNQLRRERAIQGNGTLDNDAQPHSMRSLGVVGSAAQSGISVREAELVAALAQDPRGCHRTEDAIAQKSNKSECSGRRHERYRAAA